MHKLLVMTDLHLRAPGGRIIGLDPLERLRAALDHALARHGDAEALVLTGDLTHAGEDAAYRALADLLTRVPMPVLPMIGNHDDRAAFRRVFADATVTDSGHVQGVRDIGSARIVTLDTVDAPPFSGHSGRLGPERMDWLDRALSGAAGRQAIVFAHHPPMPVGLPGMDVIALTDGAALVDRLLAHDAPVHLVCGHVHRTISGHIRRVPFTLLKGTCHQGVLDLVSLDSSLSVDEPGAYGVVLFDGDSVVVHSEDVLDSVPVSGYEA